MLSRTTFSRLYVAFILSFDGKIYGYYRKMLVTLQSKRKASPPALPRREGAGRRILINNE